MGGESADEEMSIRRMQVRKAPEMMEMLKKALKKAQGRKEHVRMFKQRQCNGQSAGGKVEKIQTRMVQVGPCICYQAGDTEQ